MRYLNKKTIGRRVEIFHTECLVTVLMSVYKTEISLLDRAVKSITNQTYGNIEFIIIDDGCDEDCSSYLRSLDDRRIIIVRNERNIGLAASLNIGIEMAKGKYIARMDADDYSLPDRIHKQVLYLEEHGNIDVLACISADICNDRFTGGIGGGYRRFDNDYMKIELSLAPKTFPHPTVVFRTSFMRENNIRYDETFMRAQDYDMWAMCSMLGKLDSLQEMLLLYNVDDSIGNELSEDQRYYSDKTKIKCLMRILPNPSEEEKDLYIHMRDMSMKGSVNANLSLVRKLIDINKEKKVYDPKRYTRILYFWWGRKMLYPENKEYLIDFLKRPGFVFDVILAFFDMLPKHIIQYFYVKQLAHKYIRKYDGAVEILR